MSRWFKYIDDMSNINVSFPDNIMEGDRSDGTKFNRLMISDNTTEIIKSPIDIITVPSSEDNCEDSGEDISALSDAEVSESSGDEGGDDLEKGEPRKGDPRVDQEDVHDLKGEEEEDEFIQIWGKLGLQPDRCQIDIVKENWRKIKGRTEVIWQDLRQVIIDAFKEQGRSPYPSIYQSMLHQIHQHHQGIYLYWFLVLLSLEQYWLVQLQTKMYQMKL